MARRNGARSPPRTGRKEEAPAADRQLMTIFLCLPFFKGA